jgi:hypothetical protein
MSATVGELTGYARMIVLSIAESLQCIYYSPERPGSSRPITSGAASAAPLRCGSGSGGRGKVPQGTPPGRRGRRSPGTCRSPAPAPGPRPTGQGWHPAPLPGASSTGTGGACTAACPCPRPRAPGRCGTTRCRARMSTSDRRRDRSEVGPPDLVPPERLPLALVRSAQPWPESHALAPGHLTAPPVDRVIRGNPDQARAVKRVEPRGGDERGQQLQPVTAGQARDVGRQQAKVKAHGASFQTCASAASNTGSWTSACP